MRYRPRKPLDLSKPLMRIERRGGARANAGRKKGGHNNKTRLLAEAAAAQGITPIEVMLKNMRFYDDCAEGVTAKLQEAMALMTPEIVAQGGERVVEVLKLIQRMGDFRMKAQECAVDAAVYIHPRLASIDFNPPPNPDSIEVIKKLMPPKQAAALYAQQLKET